MRKKFGGTYSLNREFDGKKKGLVKKHMIVPVRCFSCGKIVGSKFEEFSERVKNGEDAGKVLNDLGLVRYCCRRTVFGHVDLTKEISKFNA